MPVKGDFAQLNNLRIGFVRLALDGMGATRAAMQATRDLSEHQSEQEAAPTGQAWAELAPSTIRRRRPGPKLRRIYKSRRWQLLGRGRWRVTNPRKPHDIFHTLSTKKMPARPDLPVMPGGMLAYGSVIGEALGEWIRDTFTGAGVRLP